MLRVEDLKHSFGDFKAVNGANLTVEKGKIVAVIGPNGAGKTTLFNLITGHLKPGSGRIWFDGQDIVGLPPYVICKKGIVRSFQLLNIFARLTVFENVQVAVLSQHNKSLNLFRPTRNMLVEETNHILENVGLLDKAHAIALGTHRGLTSTELESVFGADLLARYPFVNHDCHAPDLVPAGRLPTGRVVKINRAVQEATFRIGIGSIFPHPMNGFGGGGKILFPGVADFDSIREHHFQYTFHEGTGLGKMEGNLFYEQVSHIATEARLDFIVNTVLDQKDQAHDLVCGHPVHAHLAGIQISKGIISQEFPGKSDLTVITSFPYSEGPQIVKPLAPAAMVTREGGAIILCADLEGDLPVPFVESFERFHREHGHDLLGGVLDHFQENRLIMEGGAIDFNMALAMTLATQHRFKSILVSEDISREQGEKMGFRYARDLAEAFHLGSVICPPRPTVHIIPSGGVILPVLRPR